VRAHGETPAVCIAERNAHGGYRLCTSCTLACILFITLKQQGSGLSSPASLAEEEPEERAVLFDLRADGAHLMRREARQRAQLQRQSLAACTVGRGRAEEGDEEGAHGGQVEADGTWG